MDILHSRIKREAQEVATIDTAVELEVIRCRAN
jgi:hypothetical protein